MSVNYDLYKTNPLNGSDDEGMLRARFVSKGTVDNEELIKWVHLASGYSPGQVKGFISCLCDGILQYLEDGYEVHIDELGHFSLSLASRAVGDKKEIRAESVEFRKVLFQASRKVRTRLSTIQVQRVTNSSPRSAAISLDEKAAILRNFLADNPCITAADYARITHTLKNKALKDLNEFIAQGWLRRYGSGRTVVYLLNG